MSSKRIFQRLALLADASNRCATVNNMEWHERHRDAAKELVRRTAPSGSGIDKPIEFDISNSGEKVLIFNISFHHMDENGMYAGWTDHRIKVTPSLMSLFNIKITGPNRNDIKSYLHEIVSEWLANEEMER